MHVRSGDGRRRTDAGWLQGARAATTFGAGRFARSTNHPGGFLPFYLPLDATGLDYGETLIAALDLTLARPPSRSRSSGAIRHSSPAAR